MKLAIEGALVPEVNRTYCQNLCLILFPGAKFPQNESNDSLPFVSVRVDENEGVIVSSAEIVKDGILYDGYGEFPIARSVSRDRAIKTAVGKAILSAGEKLLGELPPWGILTGVRPAKIGRELWKMGYFDNEWHSAIRDIYLVSEPKAKLLQTIMNVQKSTMAMAAPDTCSLYVSIPFCPTRCAYCSFVSYATPRYLSTIPAYLHAISEDIESVCRKIREAGKRILTVYVGGGTPTILDASQLNFLLTTIRRAIGDVTLAEFTVEAGRPDTVTAEKFDIMVSHGVNRTSINPQILNDDVLQTIGRRHTVDDFYRGYEIARRSGIQTINTDLIAGLPGASSAIFRDTLNGIEKLSPDNVTVHTYCVKRAADFTEEAVENGDKRGIFSYAGGDTALCVEEARERFEGIGYRPYYLYRQKNARGNLENVGYAKPGYEGLYNILIMEELQDIYAVGAGAVTKLIGDKNEKITRIFEPKYTYEYLRNHQKNGN